MHIAAAPHHEVQDCACWRQQPARLVRVRPPPASGGGGVGAAVGAARVLEGWLQHFTSQTREQPRTAYRHAGRRVLRPSSPALNQACRDGMGATRMNILAPKVP